jgi:hypothetical protein
MNCGAADDDAKEMGALQRMSCRSKKNGWNGGGGCVAASGWTGREERRGRKGEGVGNDGRRSERRRM